MIGPGRNDPCPCGSGRKYKQCCLGKQAGPANKIKPGWASFSQQALDLFHGGNFSAALALCNRTDETDPHYGLALGLAGLSHYQLGNPAAAIDCLQRAIRLAPSAGLHYNLGVIQQATDQPDAAEKSYRAAIALAPDAKTLGNLGGLLYKQSRFDEAIELLTHSVELSPDDAGAHNNLALALLAIGQSPLAITHLQTALSLQPHYEEAHSSLIFAMDLAPGITLEQQLNERRKWQARHTTGITPATAHQNRPDPDRRLRIGYVSADLWRHSAWSVFSPMLLSFDREQLEVYAYANTHKADEATTLLKSSVDAWRTIADMNDADAAALVQQDEIDILVDLSGHSLGNRLQLFARKPAPIQITAWGYASSTGLDAIDVFFADPVVVPAEECPLYTEEVRYLPNLLCANFLESFPPVSSLPAVANDHITFGSLNRLSKVSGPTLELWAGILNHIPHSRLILKTPELENAPIRDHILEQFIAQGVDAHRVELLGKTSWREHVLTFQRVDIALDPVPHGGGVSTLEALNMGVPVITLKAPTIAGRLSASILSSLGLTDWIADTPQAYLDLALHQPENLAYLAQLRGTLRQRFASSVLADHDAYNRAVESEYRKLWQRWCAQQGVV